MKQINEYQGISLFNDIDDWEERALNRAKVLLNMMSSSNKRGLRGYRALLPEDEYRAATIKIAKLINERFHNENSIPPRHTV